MDTLLHLNSKAESVCYDTTYRWRIQDFRLRGGGHRAVGRHFSAKTYAKTKELDPIGGAGSTPPGSANAYNIVLYILELLSHIVELLHDCYEIAS